MDYKELIRRLDDCGEFDGDLLDDAAEAIETLLAERDAAMEDLRLVADCTSCKWHPFDSSCDACLECSCENENVAWQWRGPTKGDAK